MHSSDKALKDFGEKVSAAERTAIETAIADLKTALAGDDKDAIEAKTNALAQASMKLGEAMYAANAAGKGSADGGPGAGAGGDEGVVDADFEEVKDDDSKKSA
jgi:molecular chaperone DnaK